MGQIQVRVLEHFIFWKKINLTSPNGWMFISRYTTACYNTFNTLVFYFLRLCHLLPMALNVPHVGKYGPPSHPPTNCCLVINYWRLFCSNCIAFLVRLYQHIFHRMRFQFFFFFKSLVIFGLVSREL